MMFGLQRWKAGSLLATWIAYWVALVGVTIGPGLYKGWRLTRAPGSHGMVSASFDNGRLLFDVNDTAAAAGVWHFSTSLSTAIAWIAIPPLALWVLWLVSRPRRGVLSPADNAMLNEGQLTARGESVPGRAPADRVGHTP
jgi:hypothetical protein